MVCNVKSSPQKEKLQEHYPMAQSENENLLLNKVEALCVLMQSCGVALLLSPPQLFLISSPLLIFPPFLLFFASLLPFCPLLPLPHLFPPLFARWGGHVPAASVAAPGLDGLRASHTPEGRLRAAHFPSRGAKGPLEQRRGEEKWLLQPGVGPPSCSANQKPGRGRASWLLGCATNPGQARPSSGTMALTKSTGRIVLLSRGSCQLLKTLWILSRGVFIVQGPRSNPPAWRVRPCYSEIWIFSTSFASPWTLNSGPPLPLLFKFRQELFTLWCV